jgi:hypothetical protein
MKRAWPVIVVVVVAAAALIAWRLYDSKFAVRIPEYPRPTSTAWLKQNWTAGESSWFHHTDQGTLTFGMPYEWFVALDRPKIFNGSARLSDPEYLDRFGFIPDPGGGDPAKLPVGFAHGDATMLPGGAPWLNPQSGKPFTGVGLTCAACHTGRLTYQGHEMLVDGGPALTNLGTFRQAVGVSLLFTRWLPGRLDAFEERVLGPGASATAKAALKAQIDALLAAGKADLAASDAHKGQEVEEGFGRLDALTRIGNQVFAVDMGKPENYAPITAPVHFPRIWEAPWFLWVQYDGSIEQPMVRNAGEALGVSARLQVTGPNLFQSSVKVDELYAMEKQLAGAQPTAADGFSGLRPPRWSDTPLPPVDAGLAKQGAALYAQHCQECHMPPTTSPAFWASDRWKALVPGGQRYLDLEMIDVSHIGTDPAQATGLAERTVAVPPGLGISETGFGPALGDLVGKTVKHWYDTRTPPTSPADRDRMNGDRPNGIRALLKYKVRPLDGIWATPPYLHNGSVPTLYALLSPVDQRPATFYLGNREYDPKDVGYKFDTFKNGFLFDTEKAGNSNHGHEFSDKKGPGVIGPSLSEADRRAIIEYLKTL